MDYARWAWSTGVGPILASSCPAQPRSQPQRVATPASTAQELPRKGRIGWLATSAICLAAGLIGASAQASVSGCNQGSNFGSFLVSDVTPGFICYIGDKSYTNFKDFRNLRSDDIFEISQASSDDMVHQLTVKAGGSGYFPPVESYKITYDVSVWTGDNFIRGYATGVDTSDPSGNWIKQLKSIEPKEESITISNPTKKSSYTYFPGPVTTATFISELTVNSSDFGMNLWNDYLTQRQFVPDPVPAPLPLLGAGAAWRISRRLRHRIRARV